MSDHYIAAATNHPDGSDHSAGQSDGLVDCWRPQFLRTPGERFVMAMRTSDYDALCPIRVGPPPTEVVRVGPVPTEFRTGPADGRVSGGVK